MIRLDNLRFLNSSSRFLETNSVQAFMLELKDISIEFKERNKFAHKGSFGHGLLVAGSYNKAGAAALSATAALRSGLGVLTVATPECNRTILQTSVNEAMTEVYGEKFIDKVADNLNRFAAAAIGPGIGNDKITYGMLKSFLNSYRKPMVVDADALNIIAENLDILEGIAANSILTPHMKEFERLVGGWYSLDERLYKQQEFSNRYGVIVVLKGHNTCITYPNAGGKATLIFNFNGNPGMATAGSGDVLTGIILSLLTQNYRPLQAAYMGVYLHGLAGDFAANKYGQISTIARDIIEFIPCAFNSVIK